jgi:GDP-L-fucose synthase
MNKDSKIYVAGHTGLVGSSILRELKNNNYTNIIIKTHSELDLSNQQQTKQFFQEYKPEYVFVCAAKVGGIKANNDYPADFIMENIQIANNIIKSSYENNIKKLLYLGSSCIYPKFAQQPIKEEYLLAGGLEPTNEAYSIAKIAGIKMCQAFNKQHGTNYISVMPCSLFGVGDTFDSHNSHLIPAIMSRMHNAKINNIKEIEIWGTGKPLREFMYVDDLADACLFLMKNYNDSELINVGIGKDNSISEIAYIIKDIVGYEGNLYFDDSKPDGTFRKVLDVTKINNLGWEHITDFKDGLKLMYEWYIQNKLEGGKYE